MANQQEMGKWEGQVDAFRQRLIHLRGPINDLERAELQDQFTDLMRMTRKIGGLVERTGGEGGLPHRDSPRLRILRRCIIWRSAAGTHEVQRRRMHFR
jgi:hypothetical protein